MKTIILYFALFISSNIVLAQNMPKLNPSNRVIVHKGGYTITINNGEIEKMTKDSNFITLKRDTSTLFKRHSLFEVYTDGVKPILTEKLIYNLNSISSEHIMPKADRLKKYNSKDGVTVVYLKSGVKLINLKEIYKIFNITKDDLKLPVYVDNRPLPKPNDLLAVQDEIFAVQVEIDTDHFKFLNITTKEYASQMSKNPNTFYIR
jgi:hypothetical protein